MAFLYYRISSNRSPGFYFLREAMACKSKNPPAPPKKDKRVICPICEEPIIDRSAKNAGQDSIHCDAACKTWLHRGCAGLSKSAFEVARKSDDPFSCTHCRLLFHESEIYTLKSSIKAISAEFSSLKTLVLSMKSAPNQHSAPPLGQLPPPSSRGSPSPGHGDGDFVPLGWPGAGDSNHHVVPPTVQTALKQDLQSRSDRRYNVVVFGVEECAGGTSRSDRSQSDLDSAVTVISKIVPNIQSHSVKDSFRLGKFNPTSKRPRPILVKFIRTADVTTILANKRLLDAPYSIKPDLSPDERLRDSILLKERWKLVQDGVLRSDIKIRSSKLFVLNKLHGKVVDRAFLPSLNVSVNPHSSVVDPSSVAPSPNVVNLNSSPIAADNPANQPD